MFGFSLKLLMFKFRMFLTICMLFAALFSVHGHAMDLKHHVTANIAVQAVSASLETKTNMLALAKSFVNLQNKNSHLPDFDAHQPRLTANNSFLFLHGLQTEPQYEVVHEFFAQHLFRQIFLPHVRVKTVQPWYILVYKSKKSRLSGWKDANLLYKAVSTYYA